MKKNKLRKSSITCCKCGTKKKTIKPQMDKLVAKFGSLENVHAKYHCIACRKKFNVRSDGRAKPIVNKRKKKEEKKFYDENGKVKLPDWLIAPKTANIHFSSPRYFQCPEGYSKREFNKIVVECAKEYLVK